MPDLSYEVHLLELEIEKLVTEFPELAEEEQLRADMLEGSTNAMEVLSRITSAGLDAKSMSRAISNRVDDLKSRASRCDRKEEAMRRLALRLMQAGDMKKAPLPEATLTRVKGRDSVDVFDEGALPAWAFKTEVSKTVSKADIKKAIEDGLTVAGAKMKTGDETLMVKVS
jgi:hypothetical protein